jgi:hypothetical protein
MNQRTAELPSAFRVSSQPSSSPTGRIVMPVTPITVIITNSPAVLCGFTAHTRESHAPARMGTRYRSVTARWCVNTRSNSGEVMIAAIIPVRSKVAPMMPLISSE